MKREPIVYLVRKEKKSKLKIIFCIIVLVVGQFLNRNLEDSIKEFNTNVDKFIKQRGESGIVFKVNSTSELYDDYRNAYDWVNKNTHESSRIMVRSCLDVCERERVFRHGMTMDFILMNLEIEQL